MERTTFKIILASELEDFYGLIIEKGFQKSDFHIAEEVEPPYRGVYFMRGKALIKHLPSGFSFEYQAGHQTAWVTEFRNDLLAGKLN